jgi:hypothetical protein
LRKRSHSGIVYSQIDVKAWIATRPSVDVVRPGCCAGCSAASRPSGSAIVVRGHGLRERQVRGPAHPDGQPELITIWARRYRCTRCGAVMVVLPQGLTARRHYSASAIGLAFALYGLMGRSLFETRRRVSPWAVCGATGAASWATLRRWARAVEAGCLFGSVRTSPSSWSLRPRAERVATTLMAAAPPALRGEPPHVQVFAGAALAA